MRAEARSRDLSRSHGGDSITKEASSPRLGAHMATGNGGMASTYQTVAKDVNWRYTFRNNVHCTNGLRSYVPARNGSVEGARVGERAICQPRRVRKAFRPTTSNKRPFLVMRKTYRPPTPSKDNPSPPRAPHPPTAWRGVPESYGNGTESLWRPRTLLRPYSLHRMWRTPPAL